MIHKSHISTCNRREFINMCAAALPLVGIDSSKIHPASNTGVFQFDKVGLNLGSVQDQLAQNPMQTINLIQDLGIRLLELPDISLINRLHPVLTDTGFKLPSSFFPSPYITGNWSPMESMGVRLPADRNFSSVIALAEKFGLDYLVMPGIFPQERGGLAVYQRLADQLNQAGQQCKDAGIQLCYHHYSYEFQPMEETSPIQLMLKTLDSSLVKLQLDTFWLSLADIDIMNFMERNQPFLGPMHLADKASQAPQTYRAVTLGTGIHKHLGGGVVPFDEILGSELAAKLPFFFIHLEEVDNPLDALSDSVAYLKGLFN